MQNQRLVNNALLKALIISDFLILLQSKKKNTALVAAKLKHKFQTLAMLDIFHQVKALKLFIRSLQCFFYFFSKFYFLVQTEYQVEFLCRFFKPRFNPRRWVFSDMLPKASSLRLNASGFFISIKPEQMRKQASLALFRQKYLITQHIALILQQTFYSNYFLYNDISDAKKLALVSALFYNIFK